MLYYIIVTSLNSIYTCSKNLFWFLSVLMLSVLLFHFILGIRICQTSLFCVIYLCLFQFFGPCGSIHRMRIQRNLLFWSYSICIMKIFGLTRILVFISIPDILFLTPYTRILLRYSTMQNIIRTSITFTYCNSRVI